MIRSMTAFARVSDTLTPRPRSKNRNGHWAVEIKSLNHRYFEFSLRLPPALASLESRIRDRVQFAIRRGKVMVAVSQDGATGSDANKAISVDESAVRFYTGAIGKLKKRFRLQGELTISDLLRLPGIFSVEQQPQDPQDVWPGLERLLKKTLAKAVRVKEAEGRRLAADIDKRLRRMTETVEEIDRLSRDRAERIYQKLSEKVTALLAGKEADADRMQREVAFLAERSDITEEIVRLRSHLKMFRKRIKGREEMGRELDFLCQEVNREINTIASKAQLFEVSSHVVFVKGEIEKVREQIQNIE